MCIVIKKTMPKMFKEQPGALWLLRSSDQITCAKTVAEK